MPDNLYGGPGDRIAGQLYYDVQFTGGNLSNVTLTDVTINGVTTARSETIITAPGNYAALPADYVITINKITPEITTVTLPASPSTSQSYIIKDGAGNAASFPITIDGNGKTVDGQTTQILDIDYESAELIFNGTEWNVIGSVKEFNGVEGPGVSFDNAIVRFNGTSGQIVQNTPATISDAGVVAGLSIDTAGALNILKVNGTSLTAVSGTGNVVLATAPSLSNAVVGTQPAGDNSTKAASTAYVDSAVSSKALTNTHIFVGNASNVAADVAMSGDATLANTGAVTLATVNANVGSFGSATQSGTFTVNAKGLATAASNVTITPAVGSITGLGTGVATALAANIGTAGSPVVNGGALGTPSSGIATNLTGTASGLTAGTASAVAVGGITGLGTGVGTWLATPSSANLAAAITDETGSGALVFATSPALVTPALGVATATSINKVAITAPATSATLTIANGKTATFNNSITFAGTDATIMTFPSSSDTVAGLAAVQTVTGAWTFNNGKLILAGSSSGTTTLNASATASGTLTLPAATDTLIGKATTDTLTNKTFDTAGTGNSFSINGVAATANTGTGSVVRASSPTLVTPVLGAATATSINFGGTNPMSTYTSGTWTPIWTGLTVVGTPTYTGSYTKIGRLVFCSLNVQSTTTTASTALTTNFTGLPFAPITTSVISAVNNNTIASYGNGLVATSGTCYPPTWSAAANVDISFIYETSAN